MMQAAGCDAAARGAAPTDAAAEAAPAPRAEAWYVVHTKPRQERVALEQLRNQAFEAYLPLFKVLQPPRGRRAAGAEGGSVTAQTRHEPMFPRYLFLRPTRPTQSLAVVRSTVGVTRLVLFGQQPARLADAAVQAIRQAERAREQASLAQISPYEPGTPVRLLDPAFAGLQALVQSVSRDRVTLLLEILGRPQTVQVKFAHIAPL